MNSKRLGVIFFAISIVLALILIQLMSGLNNQAQEMGCFENEGCMRIESTLSVTHFAFGLIGFILALGFYLIFFSKGEETLVKRLEETKNQELSERKFDLIAKGLDDYEKKALYAVKEQDGITQNTLRLRTNMSKAKLSYVLQGLEKKGLITRTKKGKTMSVSVTI